MVTHFHFLHGFLGLPLDWGPLVLEIKSQYSDRHVQFHMHNLWKDLEKMPDPSLKNWGLQFSQKLPPTNNVLIGYSMGGRLAMHFPVWEQRKVSGIILIAANPGITNSAEKQQRGEDDLIWADKFLKFSWDVVTREWNSQSIFAFDRNRPSRKETSFSRSLLASALTNWSLGKQEDMVERLREFQCPIYYVHGSKDEKFAGIGKILKDRVPSIHVKTVPGGHTCHFTSAGDIVKHLKSFLNGVVH